MKRFIPGVTLALLLASCKHNNHQHNEAFTGNWISAKYITDIQNDTPLHNAQQDGLLFMFKKGFKDTVLLGYKFHEAVYLKLIEDENGFHYKGHAINKKDTVEYMKLIGHDTLDVNGTLFIRVIGDKFTNGIPPVLEQFKLNGTFTREDGKPVQFTADDHITGLDTFTRYSPIVDYFDDGLNLDQAYLGSNRNATNYGIRFRHDSLYIYTLHCKEYDSAAHQCGLVEYDKLLYKLCRKK